MSIWPGRMQFYRTTALLCAVVVVGAGCRSGERGATDPLFALLAPEETGIQFENQVREQDGLNVIVYESFYNGAGVGIGDVNNDGLEDVFLASNMGQSRLYVNEGNMRFRDVTEEAGIGGLGKWANGVAMVDINHDGFLDIYVSYGGPYAEPERRANELYISNGDLTFTEKAAEYGLADTGVTTQAAFFDYDKDGDLDVYLLTNGTGNLGPNVIVPKKTNGESINTDRLYRNNGNGTFSNVSREANILIDGYGLGVAVCDFNRDGWPDVYVANDYVSNDLLYVNNGDGTFTDRAAEYFRHQSYAAMGTDVADFNNDGLSDVVTVDMLPATSQRTKVMYADAGYDRQRSERTAGYDTQLRRNTLQLNNGFTPSGQPSFSEIGMLAGVEATDWSWSPLFADFDNDGWLDLLITNGLPRDITNLDFADYKMRQLTQYQFGRSMMQGFVEALKKIDGIHVHNYLFKNNGDLTFRDVSAEWGFSRPTFSTGAAYADLDGDGDLDLVINNVNENASVYRNNASERYARNYLGVHLKGFPDNPAALGTRVAVYYGNGLSQYREHSVQRGYLSTITSTLHFGLGDASTVDSIVVIWPDTRRRKLYSVQSNQVIEIQYEPSPDQGPYALDVSPEPKDALFVNATSALGIRFEHMEQYYDDFKIQPLLPHKFSQNGPGLAVGDVNGDGRDDFYVGGAFEQSGAIYIQRRGGTFEPTALGDDLDTAVSGAKHYEEDMGALFFDANGDGALDLYVVSGGGEFAAGSKYYQDRLYLGDGKGRFRQDPDALPRTTSSGSVVTAGDFDQDGDLDLFVGGRVVPTQYPAGPQSYLLENRGGKFVDATRRVCPSLENIGMVTAAVWTDFNNDHWLDLIVVGEWMPITFLENQQGRLVNVTDRAGMSNTRGWWNSISAGDFDRDGDMDYVVGNLGLNTTLRNLPDEPVRMHVSDFNRDGRLDAVISRYIDGKRYPVHLRDDLLRQMPSMQTRFPTYASYAEAEMDDLFQEGELAGVAVYESDTFASSYIENNGGTAFEIKALPIQAQLAPVFGVLAGDYDGDGKLDVLMVGNSYAAEAFTGPYDAFNGALLSGDGKGGFTPVRMQESEFYVDGDGKALAEIVTERGGRVILAATNGDWLQAFRVKARRNAASIRIGPSDAWAEVSHGGGEVEKVEFHRGSGYLSQSSRALVVTDDVVQVTIYGAGGESRKWVPDSNTPS